MLEFRQAFTSPPRIVHFAAENRRIEGLTPISLLTVACIFRSVRASDVEASGRFVSTTGEILVFSIGIYLVSFSRLASVARPVLHTFVRTYPAGPRDFCPERHVSEGFVIWKAS